MLTHLPEAKKEYQLCLKLAPGAPVAKLATQGLARIEPVLGRGGATLNYSAMPPQAAYDAKLSEQEKAGVAKADAEEAHRQRLLSQGAALIEVKRQALERDLGQVHSDAETAVDAAKFRYGGILGNYKDNPAYQNAVNNIQLYASEEVDRLKNRFAIEEKRIQEAYKDHASRVQCVSPVSGEPIDERIRTNRHLRNHPNFGEEMPVTIIPEAPLLKAKAGALRNGKTAANK